MTARLAGATVGLLVGLGVLSVWRGLPRRRRPRLMDRIQPYLQEAPRPSRLLEVQGSTPPALALLVSPAVAALARRIEQVLGGSVSVRRRLLRAGRSPDVDRFRAEQVVWGAAGVLIGIVLGTASMLRHQGSPVTALVLVGCATVGGVVGRDQQLSRAARSRERRMMTEFPTIAELLALAVGAGEGAVGALERVCRLAHGELSGELARCLADARAGANLPMALQGLADRTGLASLTRFVDGMVIAVERGTPLADVLRAQAQDARESGRRAVMEAGGKKEIAMMIPVVFLVLPVTVVFAVYPGLALLRLSI